MKKRKQQERLYLDMPFSQALTRFVGTDPGETKTLIKRAKKKKPPGGKKPSGGSVQAENVVSLKVRRVRKRNTGR
jgi:hypothetical protein